MPLELGMRTRSGVRNADELRRGDHGFNLRESESSDDPVKQEQRERVCDFLVSNHPMPHLRLLSFPAEKWRFEYLISDRFGEGCSRFVGIEWNWRTALRSSWFMPGGPSRELTVRLAEGYISGFETDFARLLYCHAGSFLALSRTDRELPGLAPRQKKYYRKILSSRYKRNTAVWLDFTSNICTETKRAMAHVGSHCDRNRPSVPVAVTLMIGRDIVTDRDKAVCELLNQSKWREFELLDSWRYTGDGGALMGTWCGLLHKTD